MCICHIFFFFAREVFIMTLYELNHTSITSTKKPWEPLCKLLVTATVRDPQFNATKISERTWDLHCVNRLLLLVNTYIFNFIQDMDMLDLKQPFMGQTEKAAELLSTL